MVAIDQQAHIAAAAGFNLAIAAEGRVGQGFGQLQAHLPTGRQALGELLQAAVVKERAGMDQQHARTQGRDVGHVMAGEQHRGAIAAVVISQETAHRRLGIHIQAEGGFIEEQHLRAMQQGRHQFGLHPLTQGQLAHGAVQFLPQFQHLGQFVDAAGGLPIVEAIHRRIHPQGVEGGQIPDQLLLLTHHQGDAAQEFRLAPGGNMAGNLQPPAAGMEQPTQHLEGGGLAGAVGAEKTHHLAGLDPEVEIPHGLNRAVLAPQEMAQGSG